MAWTLPVAVEKEFGPADHIYIYDADQRTVMRLNPTDDRQKDYALACAIADIINETDY